MHRKHITQAVRLSLFAVLLSSILSALQTPAYCGRPPYILWRKPINPASRLFVSPDGICIAAVDPDGTITCRDYTSAVRWRRSIPGVNALSIANGGRGYAAYTLKASGRNSIYLLNSQGQTVWRYRVRSPILCASVSPNGKYAAFGTETGRVYVCSFKRSRPRYRRWNVPGIPVSLCFDPKSSQLFSGLQGTGAVGAYTLRGQPVWMAEGDSSRKYTVSLCANGNYLLYHGISKSQDSSHLGILTPDGKLVWSIELGGSESKSAISYPGDYVAYGFTKAVMHQSNYTRRRYTRLYSLSGQRLWEQGGMLFKPFLVSLTPSGNTLIHDGRKAFSLLDVNGRRIGHIRMPATIRSCVPSPHSGRVAVLTGDGYINLIYAGR